MASGDVFRLSVEGRGPQGQQLVNVHHYIEGAGVTGAPGPALVAAWQATAEDSFHNTFSNTCSINKYTVRGVTDPNYGYEVELVTPVSGEQTGDAVAPQDAAIITWRTGIIGRSFRGRTYMWPMHEGSVSGGAINSGYAAALNEFAEDAISIVSTTPAGAFVKGIWSTVLQEATPVISWVVRPYLKTQRRRSPGVGN